MLIEGATGVMKTVMVGMMVVGLIVSTIIIIPNVIAVVGHWDLDTPTYYWEQAANNCDTSYTPTDGSGFTYAGPSNKAQYDQCTATQFIGGDFFKLLSVGKSVGALVALILGLLAFVGSLLFRLDGKVAVTKKQN